MAPAKETTPGPSPLSDIKNLLKELHEKVDRLEAKVEAKVAADPKTLRMILIGPPGAGEFWGIHYHGWMDQQGTTCIRAPGRKEGAI